MDVKVPYPAASSVPPMAINWSVLMWTNVCYNSTLLSTFFTVLVTSSLKIAYKKLTDFSRRKSLAINSAASLNNWCGTISRGMLVLNTSIGMMAEWRCFFHTNLINTRMRKIASKKIRMKNLKKREEKSQAPRKTTSKTLKLWIILIQVHKTDEKPLTKIRMMTVQFFVR